MSTTSTDRLDGLTTSVAIKAPVKAATTSSISLSGQQTIDGVSCVAGDRVLVKNQSGGVDNGIYIVAATAWQRAKDFDGNRDVGKGTLIYVTDGSNAGVWRVTSGNPITIGTTSISFAINDGSEAGELRASNNLSDVASSTTSFNNLSPSTTKGDLIVHNGTNDARLPVGTNNKYLKANSSAANGVEWTTIAASELSGLATVATSGSYNDLSDTPVSGVGNFVSVKSSPFNAVGDGTTDDTAAIQAGLDYINTNGGALYIPSGQYRITSALSKTFTTGGVYTHVKRPRIFGDGSGNSVLLWDGSNSPSTYMLTLSRSGSVGPGNEALSPIEGIGFQPVSGKAGYASGLKLVKWDYMTLRNIYIRNLNTGMHLQEVINSYFSSIFLAGNQYGLVSVGDPSSGLWSNNALTFSHMTIASNEKGGMDVTNSHFNWIGGSCEGNGTTASAGTGYGIKIQDTDSGSPVCYNLYGVYFEGNGSTGNSGSNAAVADIWIEHSSTNDNLTYNIFGCNFNRASSNYCPYNIYINKSSSTGCNLLINGTSFTNLSGYSASSSRPYVSVAGTNPHLVNIVDVNAYYNEPTESPNYATGGRYYPGLSASFMRSKSFGALVYKGSNQSTSDSTSTAITWDSYDYADCGVDQSYSIWRPGTSSSRLYVPPGVVRVRLRGCLRWDTVGDGKFLQVNILKNGSNVRGMGNSAITTGASHLAHTMNVQTPILNVTGGDYFELRGYQESGSSLNVLAHESTFFALEIVE